jgi:REP-associated tyrosine transposase
MIDSARQWRQTALQDNLPVRDERWSEAIAVGNLKFVEQVKSEVGFKAAHPDSAWFKPFKPFNC